MPREPEERVQKWFLFCIAVGVVLAIWVLARQGGAPGEAFPSCALVREEIERDDDVAAAFRTTGSTTLLSFLTRRVRRRTGRSCTFQVTGPPRSAGSAKPPAHGARRHGLRGGAEEEDGVALGRVAADVVGRTVDALDGGTGVTAATADEEPVAVVSKAS